MSWATILTLAAGTLLLKSVGPLLTGGRAMPAWLDRVVGLLPPALLAALVAVQTVTSGDRLVADARLAGIAVAAVAVAAVAVALRAPFIVVVLVAMAGTALARLLA